MDNRTRPEPGHWIVVLVTGLFFFLATPQTAHALCPCYDLGYLYSIFRDNKQAYCHVFKRNYAILKVQIVAEDHIATSTLDDCEMTADGYTYSREHDSPFTKEHTNHCLDTVLSACHQLRLRTIESR